MLNLIVEIRKLKRDAMMRSKSGRATYSEEQKIKVLIFTDEVLREGLTLHDAASILGLPIATLKNWLK